MALFHRNSVIIHVKKTDFCLASLEIVNKLWLNNITTILVAEEDLFDILPHSVWKWAAPNVQITSGKKLKSLIDPKRLLSVVYYPLNLDEWFLDQETNSSADQVYHYAKTHDIPIIACPFISSKREKPKIDKQILREHFTAVLLPKTMEIAKPDTVIVTIKRLTSESPLKGKTILVTAGPTRGLIDEVRFISNRSTGRLGSVIADEAYARGAKVHLILGQGSTFTPDHVQPIWVETPIEMLNVTKDLSPIVDIAIFSAAVLDYVPKNYLSEKKASGATDWQIDLITTPKIINQLKIWNKDMIVVSFKLEANISQSELIKAAQKKLVVADLVVANDLSQVHKEEHRAYIVSKKEIITVEGKEEIANKLLEILENYITT
ncbi:MAG: phosphopantothenoylcysteine decarboxylase [Promethearchaeota archaeon]